MKAFAGPKMLCRRIFVLKCTGQTACPGRFRPIDQTLLDPDGMKLLMGVLLKEGSIEHRKVTDKLCMARRRALAMALRENEGEVNPV